MAELEDVVLVRVEVELDGGCARHVHRDRVEDRAGGAHVSRGHPYGGCVAGSETGGCTTGGVTGIRLGRRHRIRLRRRHRIRLRRRHRIRLRRRHRIRLRRRHRIRLRRRHRIRLRRRHRIRLRRRHRIRLRRRHRIRRAASPDQTRAASGQGWRGAGVGSGGCRRSPAEATQLRSDPTCLPFAWSRLGWCPPTSSRCCWCCPRWWGRRCDRSGMEPAEADRCLGWTARPPGGHCRLSRGQRYRGYDDGDDEPAATGGQGLGNPQPHGPRPLLDLVAAPVDDLEELSLAALGGDDEQRPRSLLRRSRVSFFSRIFRRNVQRSFPPTLSPRSSSPLRTRGRSTLQISGHFSGTCNRPHQRCRTLGLRCCRCPRASGSGWRPGRVVGAGRRRRLDRPRPGVSSVGRDAVAVVLTIGAPGPSVDGSPRSCQPPRPPGEAVRGRFPRRSWGLSVPRPRRVGLGKVFRGKPHRG